MPDPDRNTAKEARILKTRKLLVETFPLCFAGKGEPRKPLAHGIVNEVFAVMPEIGMSRLRETLDDYTEGPAYLASIVAGAARVGLHGEACGVVTAGEAEYAADRARRFVRAGE